jgi:carbon-monoxide dehydrogenase small subunit
MSEETHTISVQINGRKVKVTVEARMLLSDLLRGELGLTGTHVGCAHGVCGACTVMIDGQTARSCLTFAVQMDGATIETVETLGDNASLNVLQQAFHEKHALQCGFCTPGVLMSATQLLNRNPDPTETEIRRALSGNLCRCTGYVNIIRAVKRAAERMRGLAASSSAHASASRE